MGCCSGGNNTVYPEPAAPVTEVAQVRAPQPGNQLYGHKQAVCAGRIGSVITLAPGGFVRFYYVPFVNNKRDISLQGQAWFKVAKMPADAFLCMLTILLENYRIGCCIYGEYLM